jgi:23S rRNA (cytidine1920-2'-O)/16S rRNA (cytidine1409-2'-O)-methyltransferase
VKKRLDVLLTERGLAASRTQAQAFIMAGLIPGYDKPGQQVDEDAELSVVRGPAYVSRGGEKLAHALDELGVDPDGLDVLDVGASTGGFTDVLLQRGAARVIAVDVGYGQLVWSLQTDERVTVMDRTNVRTLTLDDIGGEPVDLVVSDLSFISLTLVLPALIGVVKPDGDLMLMVKPQFEVGKERLGKGGVVRDPELRADAVRGVAAKAVELGWGIAGVAASPLPGPSGNVEYFLWIRRSASALDETMLQTAVRSGPQ